MTTRAGDDAVLANILDDGVDRNEYINRVLISSTGFNKDELNEIARTGDWRGADPDAVIGALENARQLYLRVNAENDRLRRTGYLYHLGVALYNLSRRLKMAGHPQAESTGSVIRRTQDYLLEQPWQRRPITQEQYIRDIQKAYLRQPDITANEKREVKRLIRNLRDTMEATYPSQVRSIDAYGDLADSILERSPIPQDMNAADRVGHVLRVTRGQGKPSHALPAPGEAGLLIAKKDTSVYDDGSVLLNRGNVDSHAPGSPEATNAIRRVIQTTDIDEYEQTHGAENADKLTQLVLVRPPVEWWDRKIRDDLLRGVDRGNPGGGGSYPAQMSRADRGPRMAAGRHRQLAGRGRLR